MIENYTRAAYDCGAATDEAVRAAACNQKADYARRLGSGGSSPIRTTRGLRGKVPRNERAICLDETLRTAGCRKQTDERRSVPPVSPPQGRRRRT